jgi:hypothetical protein
VPLSLLNLAQAALCCWEGVPRSTRTAFAALPCVNNEILTWRIRFGVLFSQRGALSTPYRVMCQQPVAIQHPAYSPLASPFDPSHFPGDPQARNVVARKGLDIHRTGYETHRLGPQSWGGAVCGIMALGTTSLREQLVE